MPAKVSVKVNRAIGRSGDQAIRNSDSQNPDSPLRSEASSPARQSDSPTASVIDLRSQNTQPVSAPVASTPVEDRVVYAGNGDRGYSDLDYASGGRDVPTQEVRGTLDIAGEGHGFLRPKFRPSD